ncbi:hypothetical protein PCNPT3_06140 [Psychromonas sp. CNPT3]|uniref:hypothetical protein n=1 Tax=Psychromonas sp. CNPT3 TaxID=314282 RepID=UPI00006E9D09|nr:hypothetical protein [Psychromonas sp. CNPT3]AGH81170.1 hypothetical protein PCNPT3_06140 [Psychromonas sp. CNPT3]
MEKKEYLALFDKFKQKDDVKLVNNSKGIGAPKFWAPVFAVLITLFDPLDLTMLEQLILSLPILTIFLYVSMNYGFYFLYKSMNWQQPVLPSDKFKYSGDLDKDIEEITENLALLELSDIFTLLPQIKVKSSISIGCFITTDVILFKKLMRTDDLILDVKYKDVKRRDAFLFFYQNAPAIKLLNTIIPLLINAQIKDLNALLANKLVADLPKVLNALKNIDTFMALDFTTTMDNNAIVATPDKFRLAIAELTPFKDALPSNIELEAYLLSSPLKMDDLRTLNNFISDKNNKVSALLSVDIFRPLLSVLLDNDVADVVTQHDTTYQTFVLSIERQADLLKEFSAIEPDFDSENTDFKIKTINLQNFMINNDFINLKSISDSFYDLQKRKLDGIIPVTFYGELFGAYLKENQTPENIEQFIEAYFDLTNNGFIYNSVVAEHLFGLIQENKVSDAQIYTWLLRYNDIYIVKHVFFNAQYDAIDRTHIINKYLDSDCFNSDMVDMISDEKITNVAIYQTFMSTFSTYSNNFFIYKILPHKALLAFDIKETLDNFITLIWNELDCLHKVSSQQDVMQLIATQLGNDALKNFKSNISKLETELDLKQKAEETRQSALQTEEYQRQQAISSQNAENHSKASYAQSVSANKNAVAANRKAGQALKNSKHKEKDLFSLS